MQILAKQLGVADVQRIQQDAPLRAGFVEPVAVGCVR
jgi:hypothetical protein